MRTGEPVAGRRTDLRAEADEYRPARRLRLNEEPSAVALKTAREMLLDGEPNESVTWATGITAPRLAPLRDELGLVEVPHPQRKPVNRYATKDFDLRFEVPAQLSACGRSDFELRCRVRHAIPEWVRGAWLRNLLTFTWVEVLPLQCIDRAELRQQVEFGRELIASGVEPADAREVAGLSDGQLEDILEGRTRLEAARLELAVILGGVDILEGSPPLAA